MSHRQAASHELCTHFVGQFQQAHVVGNRTSIFADRGSDLIVRQSELVSESLIRGRFVNSIQIFALNVLDERQLQQLAFVVEGDVANDNRHLQQAGTLGGAPPPLTGDDAVQIADLLHEDRLDDAVFTN